LTDLRKASEEVVIIRLIIRGETKEFDVKDMAVLKIEGEEYPVEKLLDIMPGTEIELTDTDGAIHKIIYQNLLFICMEEENYRYLKEEKPEKLLEKDNLFEIPYNIKSLADFYIIESPEMEEPVEEAPAAAET
jgi:hypothetical protein